MFQYTTETIINSNIGKLPGDQRFFSDVNYVVIDGVNTFKKKYISAIYKSPYREAAKATATIAAADVASVAKNDVIRLTVTLSEIGNVRSSIQNAYLRHTKPFHYEFLVEEESTTTAKLLTELAKLIRKDMRDTDFSYFKAEVTGDTDSEALVLTAEDCYIQFDSVKLEKVTSPADGVSSFGGYARELTESILDSKAVITRGDQGAGTVARLVKDLRIPTGASINPFGADQGGRPIPGGKYTQYLIEYKTERRHVAGTVVGSVDTSITSHVFFIEEGILAEWEALFNGIELEIENPTTGDLITTSTGTLENSNIPVAGKAVDDGGTPLNSNVTIGVTDSEDAGRLLLNSKTPDVGSVQ